MKKCPFCAKEIQDEAIVCKHCGKDLITKEEAPAQPSIGKGEIMKKCPYCAEEIYNNDIFCMHCGKYLLPKKEASAQPSLTKKWIPTHWGCLIILIFTAIVIYIIYRIVAF